MKRAIALLLSCLGVAAPAQQFSVMPLPTQRLLPTSINIVFQDSEGYLWHGTRRAGVCRDNGYQLDVFSPSALSHDVESDYILSLGHTAADDVLIGSAHGLFGIGKKDYVLRWLRPADERIEALLTDSRGRTWVGLCGRVLLLHLPGGLLPVGTDSIPAREYAARTTGKAKPIVKLYEDRQGTIFALEWKGGLLLKRSNDDRFRPLVTDRPLNPVSIVQDNQEPNTYWVATRYEGVVRLDVDGTRADITLQPATQGDGGHRGLGMLQDRHYGLLWVSTMDNVYAYSITAGGSLEPFPLDRWIPAEKKILDAPLQLRSGAIYVPGSMPQTFIITPEENPVVRLDIDAMQATSGYPIQAEQTVEDSAGMWIVHQRVGLCFYERATGQLHVVPYSLSPCICKDSNTPSGIYASHRSSLYHLRLAGGTLRRTELCNMPDSMTVRGICEGGSGVLYVATDRHIYHLSLASRQIRVLGTTDGTPTSFIAAGRLLLWLYDGHLYWVDTSNPLPHGAPHLAEGTEKGVATAADMNGNVYVATQDGCVLRYQPATDSLARMDYMNSENGAPFLHIAVDGTGHVWTVTEQQVKEFNPQNRAFRTLWANAPQINVSYFRSIDVRDANHLCINAAGALCMVQPSQALNQPAAAVTPRLSAYSIDGQKHYALSDKGEIQLGPEASDLTLYLTTLDQPAAQHIAFAYRLEGISRDWVYGVPGDNIVHLNKLPVGSYQLQVMATDHNGCWSKPVTLFTLTSLPAWHQTWWAHLLGALLIAAGVFGVWKLEQRIRVLHRLIRRREQVRLDEIELTREDITEARINDEFLRKAVTTVEQHLSDTDFNVEALASAMCMSRTNLHRHMKAQTGLSPTDFIRDIRLKKAAQIFAAQPDVTITDVAARVGFATPKYLTKCFRNKFGMSPREYGSHQPQT